MMEVVSTFEGPFTPVECLDNDRCEHSPWCGQRDVWKQVQEAVQQILASTTIADLVAKEKEKQQRLVYYI